MLHIVLACGSGIATSTAVANKVSTLLNDHGLAGQFTIHQCAIAEAASNVKQYDANLLISTTVVSGDMGCPVINGVSFLTGIGRAQTEQQILDILTK